MSRPAPARQWQRLTPVQRIVRSMLAIIGVTALVWSFKTIEIIPEFFQNFWLRRHAADKKNCK